MAKKVKKTRVSVNVGGNEVVQSFDGESLKQAYIDWKREHSNPDDLYIVGDSSVLSLLKKHGVAGRGGVGHPSDNTGAGSIIDTMDKVLLQDNLIMEDEKIALMDVKEDLTYTEANNNPKDIPFRVPIKDSYNKKLGKWEWETVRGHYRTEGYMQKRTLPPEEGGDGAEESVDAAPPEYFNGQPPMWKALFGSGGFKSMTLKLLDNLKSAEVSIPTLNVRQGGTAQTILKVGAVEREFQENLLGEDYRRKDGLYNGAKASRDLQTVAFKGGKDDDLVKRAAGVSEIEGDIAGYKLNVTPLILRKIAVSLGFEEKPESEGGAETKEDKIGKSWQEILKAKECPNCGTQMKRSPQGILRRRTGKWFCPKCRSKFNSWENPPPAPEIDHRGKIR